MGFTTDQILTLAKAGFTATQIAALNNVGGVVTETINPQNPQTQPQLDPTPAMPIAAAPAAPAPTPAPTPAENQATVDDVLAAINGLTTTFQAGMLNAAVQPQQPRTAEDILAEIINPPLHNKEAR